MFAQSISQLRQRILYLKLPEVTDKMVSLKWLLLSGAIKPRSLGYDDILYELNKKRMLFKQLYFDYQQAGPFLKDANDIIVKDIKRLDPQMVNTLHFSNTFPALNATMFRNVTLLVLRMLIRFEVSRRSTIEFSAEYFQGMHEIVAFIFYSFVNQLDALTLREIDQAQHCITCKLENVVTDTYFLARRVITKMLPLYLDHQLLGRVSLEIYQHIRALEPEFYRQLQREIAQIPPIITFAQKSLKLLFIRDFGFFDRCQKVWDVLFCFSGIEPRTNYQFLAFLTSQIYTWRYLNMSNLGLQLFVQVFLE